MLKAADVVRPSSERTVSPRFGAVKPKVSPQARGPLPRDPSLGPEAIPGMAAQKGDGGVVLKNTGGLGGARLAEDRVARASFVEEVDRGDALKYLRKETTLAATGKKGYALVMFEGVPLGWVNMLDNRINNLYPSDWRIRMGG